MSQYVSKIDSERFGFLVAKFNHWEVPPHELITHLKNEKVKLIITRLPAEDLATINTLEMHGFQVKDTQLTYGYRIKNVPFTQLKIPEHIEIREVIAEDLPQIALIARHSFQNYGHYFNNDRLNIEKTNEIYEDWALRSFSNKEIADKFFVAATNSEVAGFLTFKCYQHNGQSCAKGGVGAIAEPFRNQQIFRLLVQYGLLWGKQRGLDWQEHNALTTNYAVGKVFTSLGFYNAASFVTLHCWLD